jgi:hypothetical protein
LLPFINLLAGLLPILLILNLALRRMDPGSAQRRWGVLATGLTLGVGLILTFEMGGVILLVIGVTQYISSSPALLSSLENLSLQIQNSGMDTNRIAAALGPYLTHPRVIFSLILAFAGIIPLIEELFKSIAIWFLVRRRMTPADGFAVGILSGAAYAIFESLVATASMQGDQWLIVIVARLGTDVLHILTTGIMGWGLATAWSGKGRGYWTVILSYLASVLLHGLWNFQTIAAGISQFVTSYYHISGFFFHIGSAAPIGMILQTLVMIVFLGTAYRWVNTKPALESAAISDESAQ